MKSDNDGADTAPDDTDLGSGPTADRTARSSLDPVQKQVDSMIRLEALRQLDSIVTDDDHWRMEALPSFDDCHDRMETPVESAAS